MLQRASDMLFRVSEMLQKNSEVLQRVSEMLQSLRCYIEFESFRNVRVSGVKINNVTKSFTCYKEFQDVKRFRDVAKSFRVSFFYSFINASVLQSISVMLQKCFSASVC